MRCAALLLVLLAAATVAPAQSRSEVGVQAPPVGVVFEKKQRRLTRLRGYSPRNDRLPAWTTIIVDFTFTNREALTGSMGHELSHSLHYKQLSLPASRRTSPPKKIAIDEGEEPVDDDTPIVIPKP